MKTSKESQEGYVKPVKYSSILNMQNWIFELQHKRVWRSTQSISSQSAITTFKHTAGKPFHII